MAAPELTTPRLRLRPWTLDDAPAFHRIWGDPTVIFWGAAETLDKSREVLSVLIEEQSDDQLGWYAMVERASGDIVGNATLRRAPYREGLLELGWHVAKPAQRRGFAKEAAQRLIRYAFQELAAGRVGCIVLPDNAPSQAVAASLGFVRVGEVTYKGYLHDELRLERHGPARR